MHTSSKHVLYLSIDGMTDPLGQSQVLPYLAGLSKTGYVITLISCDKPDRYRENKEIIQSICDQAGIDWQSIEYKSSIPLASSFSNIQSMRKLSVSLHKKKNFSLVHCRSYLPMFAGVHLKKKYGVKLLFDIRGFWPDERVDGGLWNLKHPLWKTIYGYFKNKEKQFFEASDHVISLTHNAKQEIHSRPLTNNPLPIDVIPCCADLELFNYENVNAANRNELMSSLQLSDDDYIVTYLGSLGTFYAIEDMLSYFQEVKLKHSNARFLVITASPPSIVWEAVEKMGINKEDVRVTRAARKDVPVHLSLGKYSLIFYRDNFSRKACSPTKLGELMGLGLPSVCSPNIGDTTEIILDTRSGIPLKKLTKESYAEAVLKIDDVLSTDKATIRTGAYKYFDLEKGIQKYIRVYEALV